jgi:hypothetical protein
MDITIRIPDDKAAEIVDGLCGYFRYDTTKKAGETKPAFCKRMVVEMIKNSCKGWQDMAVASTTAAAKTAIDNINIT